MSLIFFYIVLFFLTSFYRFNFLIFFVNVPLIILIYLKPLRRVILISLFSSALAASISLNWVIKYSFSAYFVSVAIFSSFIFIFAIAFNLLSKRVTNYLKIFIAPFLHLVLMFIYDFSLINSYWADWSMFQPTMAPVIWFVGSYGVTFLIVLIQSIIAFFVIEKNRKVLMTGIIIIIFVSMNLIYSYNAKPQGQKIKVALLQGNINESWNWRKVNSKGIILDTYENLSIEASKNNPGIILWPEYALVEDVVSDDKLFQRVSNIAKKTKSYLVVGSLKWHPTFYKNERELNDVALIFNPDGQLIGDYIALKPLPFEKRVLPGNEAKVFNTTLGKFGIALCYEETQKIAKEFTLQGANFLISLANNQKLKDTQGFYLANLYSNLRAAENGKYLIRVTNNGITKVVNPYGKTEIQLKPYKKGILIADIYTNNKVTFYANHGNLIVYGILIILSALLFARILDFQK